MKFIRATLRLMALVLVTVTFCVSFLALKPFFRSRSKALAWRNWNFRTWARTVVRLLNVQVSTSGPRPSASFLLVSNHLSYIDIVVLASQVNCAFIAKREVASWPLVGRLATWFNTIFINRQRKSDVISAMNEMQRLIDAGLGVVLFAEGTSTSGQQVSPFKSGTLELAARRGAPVHYSTISYTTKLDETSADQSVCWWGDMTFPDHFFRMLQLTGFKATLTFGNEPITDRDRHILASRLWQAASAQFIPVVVHR